MLDLLNFRGQTAISSVAFSGNRGLPPITVKRYVKDVLSLFITLLMIDSINLLERWRAGIEGNYMSELLVN